MSEAGAYNGACFCGAVQFVLVGQPVAMGYCHCESCRHWSAGPVNAFTLWKPDALTVMRGAPHIVAYSKTPNSSRKWCGSCGGHLFTHHPAADVVDVYAALIPQLIFAAGMHVHYQESVLPIVDDLPKMKDMPLEMGGSGIEMSE
jgi:hypothetical protein